MSADGRAIQSDLRYDPTPSNAPRFAGDPLVVVRESGTVANPIDKVFKRARNGPEDDLAYFFRVMTGREVPAPPDAPRMRSWLARLLGRR